MATWVITDNERVINMDQASEIIFEPNGNGEWRVRFRIPGVSPEPTLTGNNLARGLQESIKKQAPYGHALSDLG